MVVWWTVIVVLVASVARFVGSWAGARMAVLGNRDGMAPGSALNARGALEIVIATVGLSLGVLNDASFTIVVMGRKTAEGRSSRTGPLNVSLLVGSHVFPARPKRFELLTF